MAYRTIKTNTKRAKKRKGMSTKRVRVKKRKKRR